MTFDIITTAEELLQFLTDLLHLDTRTITFHIINDEYIGGGLIDDPADLSDDDTFLAIAEGRWDQTYIHIDDVITYQIGTGESDDADYRDTDALEKAWKYCPDAFTNLLFGYADILSHLRDLDVLNPACELDDSLR